jgi:hypothetical protein
MQHYMSPLGHSLPMYSASVPINVRCYSNSDQIAWVTAASQVAEFARCRRGENSGSGGGESKNQSLAKRLVVAVRTVGKGEVHSSILCGSTIFASVSSRRAAL